MLPVAFLYESTGEHPHVVFYRYYAVRPIPGTVTPPMTSLARVHQLMRADFTTRQTQLWLHHAWRNNGACAASLSSCSPAPLPLACTTGAKLTTASTGANRREASGKPNCDTALRAFSTEVRAVRRLQVSGLGTRCSIAGLFSHESERPVTKSSLRRLEA